MEPSTFIEDILHRKFGITHIIIGQDFKFGKARSGNADMLKRLGKTFGIKVEILKIKKKKIKHKMKNLIICMVDLE
jgi:FAD synthase